MQQNMTYNFHLLDILIVNNIIQTEIMKSVPQNMTNVKTVDIAANCFSRFLNISYTDGNG